MSAPDLAENLAQGTDVARESADVIPIGSSPSTFIDALRMGWRLGL
jgi:cation transport ATPase